jgi:hypothetical protein
MNHFQYYYNNCAGSFRILRTCSTAYLLWPRKTPLVKNVITTLTFNMKQVIGNEKILNRNLFWQYYVYS